MPTLSDLNKLALNYAHHRDSTIYSLGKNHAPSDTEQLLTFYKKSVICDRTLLQSYKDICDLAEHLKNEYEFDIKTPPCSNKDFDNIVSEISRKELEISALNVDSKALGNDESDVEAISPAHPG
jgi:hypothetical protein